MDAQQFIGQYVRLRNGFLWKCRTCERPMVVVGILDTLAKRGQWLRGVCPCCMTEANIHHYDSQTPAEANWQTKLAMTRDPRWPASISKGVIDIE